MFIVFDLDGTLSNPSHREHYVRREPGDDTPKHWSAFNAACVDDPPKPEIVEIYDTLIGDTENRVEIWTGRDIAQRDNTFEWLFRNNISSPDRLRMRPVGDYTPDDKLKAKWATDERAVIDLVFEDRNRVVKMWRDLGITCCQVAPGDF